MLTNTFRACAPEKREGNNGSESQELKVEALLVAFQVRFGDGAVHAVEGTRSS